MNKEKKFDLMLDSGAFSAWTQKKEIDIDEYIAFIQRWKDYIKYYINLDSIPKDPMKNPTKQEAEEAAQKSWDNLKYMESKGLTPLPVYHRGEDLQWLQKMINEGYTYICVAPHAPSVEDKILFLDIVFDFICDEEGYPRINLHALGTTSVHILFRYPWFSSDSTTWSRAGRYGDIFIPQLGEDGNFIYNKSPMIVGVCKEERNMKRHINHLYCLPKQVRQKMEKYINDKGYSLEELSSNWVKRDELNLVYWMDVEKYAKIEKFDRTLMMKGIFDKESWE